MYEQQFKFLEVFKKYFYYINFVYDYVSVNFSLEKFVKWR